MQIFPLFIPHVGCPHRCLFCQQEKTTGQSGAWDPSVVAEYLDRLLPRSGFGEVAFYGGTFTLLPEERQREYLCVARTFVAAGRIRGIRLSTRPDALEDRHVALLGEFPVQTVEIGCQSFSCTVLSLSGRGHTPNDAGKAVDRLRRAGISIGLQLMPGLPGADRAEALYSLDKALALQPDFLRIYPTVVLAGSGLETLFRLGEFTPLTLEQGVDLGAEMLWRCQQAGVPVIRMGLQATDGLEGETGVVAGPYHPAFGQMVRSRLWRRAFTRAIREGRTDGAVCLADLSDALGQKKQNVEYLRRFSEKFSIMTREDVPRGHVCFGSGPISLMEMASYQGIQD